MQEHVLNMAIAIIMDCNLVPADMGLKSNYDLLLGGRPSRKRGLRNQKLRPRTKYETRPCHVCNCDFHSIFTKTKTKTETTTKIKTKHEIRPCDVSNWVLYA